MEEIRDLLYQNMLQINPIKLKVDQDLNGGSLYHKQHPYTDFSFPFFKDQFVDNKKIKINYVTVHADFHSTKIIFYLNNYFWLMSLGELLKFISCCIRYEMPLYNTRIFQS